MPVRPIARRQGWGEGMGVEVESWENGLDKKGPLQASMVNIIPSHGALSGGSDYVKV